MRAIYTFHPDFTDATIWWGDPEKEKTGARGPYRADRLTAGSTVGWV
jgi:hypothetical protein